MSQKITIPIAIVASVLVTAGVMYAVYEGQPAQVPEMPTGPIEPEPEPTQEPEPTPVDSDAEDLSEPEIVYIERPSGYFAGTDGIRKISSNEELRAVIDASAMFGERFFDNRMSDRVWAAATSANVMIAAESESAQFDSAATVQYSDADYSATNIQVAGVDEPDYLKNDSKYVYIVSGNTLSIIDAYPAESAELVLKVALDVESQHIYNMFLNGDRLVIFYNGQSSEEIIPQYDFVPRRSYGQVTHALIIDVSDRENPEILKDYSIDGHFRDARMIGDYAYFVTNVNIEYQHPRLPVIMEDSVPVMTSEAFYFDSTEQLSNFNTLTAIDIFGDTVNSETFLMGYTGTFYVSEDNFYLAYQRELPFGFWEDSPRDRFFDVIVPLLSDSIQDEIRSIQRDSSLNPSSQWVMISELMQESYNQMTQDDREELFEDIEEALDEYDARIQAESARTIIHKISIDEDKIEYVTKGSVPGRLLNQFSMDQEGDRFRVATTTEYYSQHQGWVRANAVYVLDEQLDTVGELDGIAPDESIFSARFMGDRLYMVTFEQIDPFFVIDLSEDTPKVLGELKIPGFSNYLHPYDEDHVIGVGRDTSLENGWVRELGIKIALFNVADVSNPKVADDIIIGDEYTHSEALYDHKAFFFDGKRDIVSIPVEGYDLDEGLRTTLIEEEWGGFYVLELDAREGIEIKGVITHSNSYYGMEDGRTFYIGDVLYTASDRHLKMNSIDSLEEINSIKLENTGKFIEYID